MRGDFFSIYRWAKANKVTVEKTGRRGERTYEVFTTGEIVDECGTLVEVVESVNSFITSHEGKIMSKNQAVDTVEQDDCVSTYKISLRSTSGVGLNDLVDLLQTKYEVVSVTSGDSLRAD